MNIFISTMLLIILINQFVIHVKLLDIEDEMRYERRLRRGRK